MTFFFLPVPLPPTDFHITREYHGNDETTVTLDWDPPEGTGPETFVDNYTISISPTPPHHQSTRIMVSSPLWNITLENNIMYFVNLTAINCAGESDPSSLLVEYGMDLIVYSIVLIQM